MRQVRVWVENGTDHFRAERYREAVTEFRKALFVINEPGLTWNIARAYEELGEIRNAVHHFEQLVERYPDDESVPSARQRLQELRPRLPGSLAVDCGDVVAARVLLDAEVEAQCGDRIGGLRPGLHSLEVVAPDLGVWRKKVRVAPDTTAVIRVAWEEANNEEPEPMAALDGGPPQPAEEAVPEPRPAAPPAGAPPAGWGLGWAAMGTLGAGAALLAAGTALGVLSARSGADYEALKGRERVTVAEIDGQAEEANEYAGLATVLFGVGAAALAAGVVLVLAGEPLPATAVGGAMLFAPPAGRGLGVLWTGEL